ncbi:hypothetical protein HK405_011413 [Cladochytrium tenue]|nr:hypothetical protein HK405_011413 [Cladochytrium tenue]
MAHAQHSKTMPRTSVVAREAAATTREVVVAAGAGEAAGESGGYTGSTPILHRMSEAGGPYARSLQRFRFITLVAALEGDVVVPYATAAAASHPPPHRPSPTPRPPQTPPGTSPHPAAAAFVVHSVSGFGAAAVARLFELPERTAAAALRRAIAAARPVVLGPTPPRGTRHHEGEAFDGIGGGGGAASPLPAGNGSGAGEDGGGYTTRWVTDGQRAVMLPTTLVRAAQGGALYGARRVNVSLHVPGFLQRAAGHALMLGKAVVAWTPPDVREAGLASSELIARVLAVDFAEAGEEAGQTV